MTIGEVESVLGPAEPSYSSDSRYDYHIWKGKDGWSRVWLKQEADFWSLYWIRQKTVYKLSFDPKFTLDD